MLDIRPDKRPLQSFYPRPKTFSSPAYQSPVMNDAKSLLSQKASHEMRAAKSFPTRSYFWASLWLLVVGVGLWLLVSHWEERLMEEGIAGYESLERALEALRTNNPESSEQALIEARKHFERGTSLLFGAQHLLPVLSFIPGTEKVESGIALMQAGEYLTTGAVAFNDLLGESRERLRSNPEEPISLLNLLVSAEPLLHQGSESFNRALSFLEHVDIQSIPKEKQSRFQEVKILFPALVRGLDLSVEHIDLLKELLGKNGPRSYLFLFQNNHELRPTGGFIGSYALLNISQGQIRRFFVDGIFNPDGQLKENIVPPMAIQKISAGWSLHDSNWFPDFPTSAEKAIFFYEKTGGPTTDGVVALTPEVLERILRVVGPVTLPEYGVTIDAENFMPLIQEEVEINYNKEENNPKKILGDLTGVILERLLSSPDETTFFRLADIFVDLLNERHILLYARDKDAQALIKNSGWSGSLIDTPYDYLSVIHTNINGYKTDGVIDDAIQHTVSLQADGSIIDTVRITRKHNGGNTPYEWWNKVNANYMRVYVPLGSELLSAEGMTRESVSPPLDYEALGFRKDADVVREEGLIKIDEVSGTRIGEEFGKTVFGNWVYVSPGESVVVTYRYKLPFRVTQNVFQTDELVPFSILYQKQPGTKGSQLSTVVDYPQSLEPIWQTPENLIPYGRALKLESVLDTTVFVGAVLKEYK